MYIFHTVAGLHGHGEGIRRLLTSLRVPLNSLHDIDLNSELTGIYLYGKGFSAETTKLENTNFELNLHFLYFL